MLQSRFMKDFQELTFYFEAEMHSLHTTFISTDHTFKICKNIGLSDSDKINKNLTCFYVLNQKGQVISWAQIGSTSFEEV